jgi:hypothetical protein
VWLLIVWLDPSHKPYIAELHEYYNPYLYTKIVKRSIERGYHLLMIRQYAT